MEPTMMPPKHDGFTEGERAIIERVAWAVGDKLQERLEGRIADAVSRHAETCPLKGKITLGKGVAIGLACAITGGGAGAVINRIIAALAGG